MACRRHSERPKVSRRRRGPLRREYDSSVLLASRLSGRERGTRCGLARRLPLRSNVFDGSSRDGMLATISMAMRLRDSRAARGVRSRWDADVAVGLGAVVLETSASGSIRTAPSVPSTRMVVHRERETSPPTPRPLGPSARAMIAPCTRVPDAVRCRARCWVGRPSSVRSDVTRCR